MSAPGRTAETEEVRERLYSFLPAIYRQRDLEAGHVLRALLTVMEGEFRRLEHDTEGLYEDWFIETCAPFIVPYIGDLLGVRGLSDLASDMFSQRAFVANTLRHRRRKGTAAVLEEVARDVTAWRARAVELFQVLSTTQHLNHVRIRSPATLSLRNAEALERINGAFDESPRTVDVRHIASGRGRHNIPHVGLFLWRLQSYPIVRGTARAVEVDDEEGFYTFSPLGLDAPLFNRPVTEREISHVAEEMNVPAPLRRRALYEDLRSYREAGWDEDATQYFGDDPVFQVFVEGGPSPVPREELSICDLSTWRRPASAQPLVAVDPVLGRLAFRDVPEGEVLVSYSYGFSADIGGGPHDRQESLAAAVPPETAEGDIWQIGVTKEPSAGVGPIVATLREAVDAWNAGPSEPVGIIAILDSRTYRENLVGRHEIVVPPDKTLLVVAADWPEAERIPGVKVRVPGHVVLSDRRPHIRGEIAIRGEATAASQDAGAAVLNGLLIEGRVGVSPGHLGRLHVAHSTIVPPRHGLVVQRARNATNARLAVSLDDAICGPIQLPETGPSLQISDSIVDPGTGDAIAALGTDVRVNRSTVFGASRTRTFEASNSICTGHVVVRRRQTGCVRFSYVPFRSATPRRYRCQPDLALEVRARELRLTSFRFLSRAERDAVLTRVRPAFNSDDYGAPGYAQLSLTGPPEIATGAEDGNEMGVFSSQKQPQRVANLRFRLEEYLPFGLEAGLIYET